MQWWASFPASLLLHRPKRVEMSSLDTHSLSHSLGCPCLGVYISRCTAKCGIPWPSHDRGKQCRQRDRVHWRALASICKTRKHAVIILTFFALAPRQQPPWSSDYRPTELLLCLSESPRTDSGLAEKVNCWEPQTNFDSPDYHRIRTMLAPNKERRPVRATWLCRHQRVHRCRHSQSMRAIGNEVSGIRDFVEEFC